MKIDLCNGACGNRFRCANLNTKKCKPYPKENEDFIKCNNFKEKEMDE